MPGIWLAGHRGARAEYPENTLGGIELAAKEGVDAVEVDVRRSREGALVVIHDATVSRTTNGHGAVAEHTLADLQKLDAGGGERIPMLADVLDLCHRLHLGLNVEIKEPEAAVAVADLVGSSPAAENVIISSFAPRAVADARLRAPHLRRALILARDRHLSALIRRQVLLPDLFDLLECEALHVHRSLMSLRLVQELHRRNYQVRVWTVDHPSDMRRFVEMGADGLITNRPSLLVRTVREAEVAAAA